jgi:hypothetical protein
VTTEIVERQLDRWICAHGPSMTRPARRGSSRMLVFMAALSESSLPPSHTLLFELALLKPDIPDWSH